jgi:hypothetical protein
MSFYLYNFTINATNYSCPSTHMWEIRKLRTTYKITFRHLCKESENLFDETAGPEDQLLANTPAFMGLLRLGGVSDQLR